MIHRVLKIVREVVGLPDTVTLQALRRTANFKLYQGGVKPQMAAKLMGHSVMTAMRNYVDFEKLDPKGAVNVLDFGKIKSEKRSDKKSDKT